MRLMKLMSAFLFILMLAGCSFMNLPFSNSAKGKIKNDTYINKIGTQSNLGTFSVKVPQASNNYEFTYMQTKEDVGPDSIYVSFGPAALDFSIYRVMVGVKDYTSFTALKQKAVPMFVAYMEKVSGQPMHKIYETNTMFKGHPAFYAVYTQYMPSYFNPIGMHKIEGTMLTHGIYYVDYGRYLVVLWTMADSDSLINAINDKNRNLFINRTWKPEVEFVNSFHLY